MALVISRTLQQNTRRDVCTSTLRIGQDVTVTLLSLKGNQVRIAIQAPKDVPIHREEIYQRLLQETGPGQPVPIGVRRPGI